MAQVEVEVRLTVPEFVRRAEAYAEQHGMMANMMVLDKPIRDLSEAPRRQRYMDVHVADFILAPHPDLPVRCFWVAKDRSGQFTDTIVWWEGWLVSTVLPSG